MVTEIHPPRAGLWRVARGPDPLTTEPPPGGPVNRFDSPTGEFSILYMGSTLDACFGETLARFRPSLELLALVADEWEALGFMRPGSVSADWRHQRVAVRARPDLDMPFIDLEDSRTLKQLRKDLAAHISLLGYEDLDLGLLRGPDRRVTQAVADWTARQTTPEGYARYAGMRYLSRLDNHWECWAVFADIRLVEVDRRPITIDMPAMKRVAKIFDLQLF